MARCRAGAPPPRRPRPAQRFRHDPSLDLVAPPPATPDRPGCRPDLVAQKLSTIWSTIYAKPICQSRFASSGSNHARYKMGAKIPLTLKGQRDICIALMFYFQSLEDIRRTAAKETPQRSKRVKIDPKAKGRAALANFIKYVRGLRQALNSVQKYLNREDLISDAEQLIEQIYKFQKSAQHELDKKSRGGRPGTKIRDDLVIRLGVIYEQLTGKPPKRSVDRNGRVCGPFPRFVYTIFRAQGISETGLPSAIENAVRYAKNRR